MLESKVASNIEQKGPISSIMAARKVAYKQAARKAAQLLVDHMETLSPSAASAMMADLRELASKGRASNRGKTGRLRKNEGPRPSRRASSKIA